MTDPYYNHKLRETARKLRNDMTKAEKKLWYQFLNKFKPKAHRQRPIGKYIADFYITKANLIIEIDGDSHFQDEAQEKDEQRTQFFNSLNLQVIRFTNIEIYESFDWVCRMIEEKIKMQDTPCAPSRRGGLIHH